VGSQSKSDVKVVATNRKAFHDYFILEVVEAGIALSGTEIKSVREGKISLREGYAKVEDGEVWLEDVYIAPYQPGSRENPPATRRRKLLLHRDEIRRWLGKLQEKGLTLVPLRVYLKDNLAKVELALVKGKKLYDKREAIAERDANRRIEQAMRERWR